MHTDPRIGIALVLAAASLWGTTGTAQTFLAGDLAASWFGALRLAVASAFFAAYAGWERSRRSPVAAAPGARLPLAALLGAGLCMAVYNLAFFAGVRSSGVAVGTAVALGSGPVWAGLLQAAWLRRAPAAAWWGGTALAVTGGALMAFTGAAPGVATAAPAGLALCLLAGLSYAVYTLLNKRLVDAAPASTITLWAFTTAAVLALPAAWFEAGAPRWQAGDIAPVLYVGIATAGVSYLLFSHALRHISAATGVTLALAEPVVAFALAVWVVGEQPTLFTGLGLVLVVLGVLAVVRSELAAAPRRTRRV